jgi:histidyl-tRNA synthetase
MSDKAQRVRGTQDIFGEEAARFDHVVATFDRVKRLYGFKPVHVPMFEATSVFARSIGETSDVVSKEMYSFEDKGGDSITLRPEFTAGIARAYAQNGWQQHAPLKLAAWGAAFRYERPQKGRYRQFHQLDAEILGAGDPAADVESIAFADHLLRELGLGEKVELRLNTVGDAATRSAWRAALIDYFGKHRDALSGESVERLEKNPLRILDSKAECDRALVADAPKIDAFLTAEAGAFFESVCAGLEASGVKWTRDSALVRGLDYYRHTAFEFVTTHLGAQGTVLGGGRYDGLVEALGGPPTPGVGWAAGVERLAMLADEEVDESIELAVIPYTWRDTDLSFEILEFLRRNGISAATPNGTSSDKKFEKAKKTGFSRALIVETGDEYYVGVVRLRDIASNAAPIRSRLVSVLSKKFAVSDDPESREISLEKRMR